MPLNALRMNKTPLNSLIPQQRSAYKRRPRADKGKPRKYRIDPRYVAQLAMGSRIRRPTRIDEATFLELISSPCPLCGDESECLVPIAAGQTSLSPYNCRPSCIQCMRVLRVFAWNERECIAWARRVCAYRL